MPAAVAAALGIHDLPAVAAADALAHALAQRQLLLVLDNCWSELAWSESAWSGPGVGDSTPAADGRPTLWV